MFRALAEGLHFITYERYIFFTNVNRFIDFCPVVSFFNPYNFFRLDSIDPLGVISVRVLLVVCLESKVNPSLLFKINLADTTLKDTSANYVPTRFIEIASDKRKNNSAPKILQQVLQ